MQRLWIISELFPPDETSTACILGEIANVMTQKYDVKVICGPEIYDKRKQLNSDHRFEVSKEVDILRVKGIETDKNTFMGKSLRFAVISYQLFQLAKQKITREDKVLLVTNPAPLVVMISRLKKKVGFDLNVLVHDVFPENIKPAGLKLPTFVYSILKKIFDKAYCGANQLLAIGRDMKQVLEKKVERYEHHPQTIVIENWADLDNVSPQERYEEVNRVDRKVEIEYAGNIGRVQGLQEFLKLLELSKNSQLNFHLWGTGAEETNLTRYVRLHKMKNVKFHGAYFRSKQSDVINSCDIALVTLTKGMFGLGVPSKTYNIMAAGKPVLYIGDSYSEIGLLVKEKDIGYVFDPEDKVSIMKFLSNLTLDRLPELKEKGEKAYKVAVEEYAKPIILNKFVEAL